MYLLSDDLIFPHPKYANKDGFLAFGGDLSQKRLLLAYSHGIFPWPNGEKNPVLWYSPNPRLVLFHDQFNLSKSLKKTVLQKKFEVKIDTDFDKIIVKCAQIKREWQDSTWITPAIQSAYNNLHINGFAHSISTYFEGNLVGGLYGVSLGKAFFGESMFHEMSDASKVAFYYLVKLAKYFDFKMIDAQTRTEHLISLGAKEINRKIFLKLLAQSNKFDTIKGNWAELIPENFFE
jgi:leucyl/phenylalanyl-tRNA--protein transferase